MTILKASGSSFIFGGFTTVTWESPNPSQFKSDQNAFLFSLKNKDNQPCKMRIKPNEHQHAIHCGSEYGPIFGTGCDIYISSNSNTNTNSRSKLGNTFKHPQYTKGRLNRFWLVRINFN